MSVRSKPNREGEAPAEPERDGSELPEGWVSARLSEITDSIRDGTHTPPKRVGEGVPLLSARNIQNGFVDFDEAFSFISQSDFEQIARTNPVNRGDVLLTIVGSLGRSCVNKLETEFAVQRSVAIIRPKAEAVGAHFLQFAFQSPVFQRFLEASAKGTAQKGAYLGTLRDALIPIAPLAEQRRIVGKLELLLGKVSSSQQRLSRVPGLLKRFRQSVLAAACSGKLTADWREENDCVEPASDLIARIGSERRLRYRELCVAAKDDKRGRPQEFDNIEPSVRKDLDTFDLPSDWSWVDLRFVMTVDEPFCYGVVQPGANEPSGNLLVRAGDLQKGTVNLSELRRIPADIDAEYERSRLKGGELLVTVVGAGIGTVAIAPASCAGFNIARAVAKVSIRDVSAEYVFQWFNTSKALSWMVGDAREVARPTLNLEQLRTILVPLPPLIEQQEIVRRVENLFAFADQIEARLKQAQAHIDRLTQSLLAKAFRGELVATEHALATATGRDYETASDLLARIRSMHTSISAAAKTVRKRNTRKPR